jgi:hypothetical protein
MMQPSNVDAPNKGDKCPRGALKLYQLFPQSSTPYTGSKLTGPVLDIVLCLLAVPCV